MVLELSQTISGLVLGLSELLPVGTGFGAIYFCAVFISVLFWSYPKPFWAGFGAPSHFWVLGSPRPAVALVLGLGLRVGALPDSFWAGFGVFQTISVAIC